jgi:hypothetical protein
VDESRKIVWLYSARRGNRDALPLGVQQQGLKPTTSVQPLLLLVERRPSSTSRSWLFFLRTAGHIGGSSTLAKPHTEVLPQVVCTRRQHP